MQPKIPEIFIINDVITRKSPPHCDVVQMCNCEAAPQVLLSGMQSLGSWEENGVVVHSSLWQSTELIEVIRTTCGIANGDGHCVQKTAAALPFLGVRRGSEEWRWWSYSIVCAVQGHHLGGALVRLSQFDAAVLLTYSLVLSGVAAEHFPLI